MSESDATRFLRSVKSYLSGDRKKYGGSNDELIEIAEKGKDPCKYCEKKNTCTTMLCIPYYIHFKKRWRNIQRCAVNEK